jgi:hypothetical protein
MAEKLCINLRTELKKRTDQTMCSQTKLCTLDAESIMSYGLHVAGFSKPNLGKKLNMQHFRSHFGIGPKAIVAILNNLPNQKNEQEQKKVECLMMTLCWLKLYKTKHVMLGRWGQVRSFAKTPSKILHHDFSP